MKRSTSSARFSRFRHRLRAAYQKFSNIQAAAYSMTFVDRGIEDVGFVAYSSNQPKPTPPTERKTLALTTPETLVYSVGSANLASTYDEVMQSLSQSGNTDLMNTAGQFQQALRNRKIHMSEDVLQRLGPEFAVIADWHAARVSPKIAIVSQVTEADKLRPALDAALDALKESIGGTNDAFAWEETESATQKLRSLHLGGRLPSPTYAVTDQFLILGRVIRTTPVNCSRRRKIQSRRSPRARPINRHETTAREWVVLRLHGSPEAIHIRLWARALHPDPNRRQSTRRFEEATAAGNDYQAPVPVRLGDRKRAAAVNLDVLFAAGQIARVGSGHRRRGLGGQRLRASVPAIRYASLAQKVFK